jgi:hypothetical protein
MGEYATYHGQRIKIGTCEDMLYLRWDQRALVRDSETPLFDPQVLAQIRFRFPWPAEDNVAPGQFEDPFYGHRLWGFEQPAQLEHGLVQFTAANGYLVSLPCPESGQLHARGRILPNGVIVALNGYGGSASLIAQAWRDGRLMGIARCNGCRHAYRLENGFEEAAAVAIRSEADREYRTADEALARGQESEGNRDIGDQLHQIAARLLAGYALRESQ